MKNSRKMWRRLAPLVGVTFWLFVSATVVLAQGPAVQRPIEEFVAAQGTHCIGEEPDCWLIIEPLPNFVGWFSYSPDRAASVDYAGLVDAYWGKPFGTTMSGSVTERPLPDGRAEVNVRLHTENALTWVAAGGDFNNPLLFGQRYTEAPDDWAGAALGESLLQIRFINTAVGAPLPDLIQLFFFAEEGQEVLFVSFKARADGTLREAYGVPDGTPGRVQVNQTGLYMTHSAQAPDGYLWPVELINLQVVGH